MAVLVTMRYIIPDEDDSIDEDTVHDALQQVIYSFDGVFEVSYGMKDIDNAAAKLVYDQLDKPPFKLDESLLDD